MHFVGLLAASFPSAIDYLVLPTLASFLICVIVVGLGVYAAHAPQPPNLRIGLGAVAMGLGIAPQDGLDALGVAPGEDKDDVLFAKNACPSQGTMDIFVEPGCRSRVF
jgi:NO-binding membrane sensor protein with MHYT domain